MNNAPFRKTSLDRISSPEQLNEYIRVTNPGVWLIIAAAAALLAGALIWSMSGTIQSTVSAGLLVQGQSAVCYVRVNDVDELSAGMPVQAEGIAGKLKEVDETPVMVDESIDPYLRYLCGFSVGDFCHAARAELPGLDDGVYPALITTESIHPIAFLMQ